MSTGAHYQANRSRAEGEGGWEGVVSFAAIFMIMIGLFHALAGVTAIFNDEFYMTTDGYLFQLDTTIWGWIHLVMGALVLFAGVGVVLGQTWARVVGIILAGLGALVVFLFIPYYPLWSLLIIVLDGLVIWALAVHAAVPKSDIY